jgi:hypothetical protein
MRRMALRLGRTRAELWPPSQTANLRGLDHLFRVELVRILSGGKPPFLTCEFGTLELSLRKTREALQNARCTDPSKRDIK